jgi:HK97 family phage prohead protease
VTKVFRATTKAAGDGNVEAVISTGSVDRDGERVLPSAFEKRLGSFMDYPVLVSGHAYSGGLMKVIGRVEKLTISGAGVTANLRYLIGQGNEEADWGYHLAAKEGLASYSIGFIPWDWKEETRDGQVRRVFTDIEVLEISHVVVPSNRDALVNAR